MSHNVSNSETKTFLVFGDLHGRILPAFRFATYWSRENDQPLDGVLQVGDLGYFPDSSNLDKATIRHAKDDPLELGTFDIVVKNELADSIFDDPAAPPALWFTSGNHEDFDRLEQLAQASGREADFAVDAYLRVRGIRDGEVVSLAGCRVGAVWGIDKTGRNARHKVPKRGFIYENAVNKLLYHSTFDVLLMHDSPANAKREGYGSELLANLVQLAQPQFAFFGHYSGDGSRVEKDFGRTELYHMAGFELREGKDKHAETGSVGVLRFENGQGQFEYVPMDFLKNFTRHNWKFC
jgi:hypothetical protein